MRASLGYRQKLIIGPVAAVVLLLASAFSCSSEERPGPDTPEPGQVPQAGPRELSGVELVRPTGLRLFAPPYLIDIDADTVTELEVDDWLTRPGGEPLLIAHRRPAATDGADDFAPVALAARSKQALPGSPPVVTVDGSPLAALAVSADGGGLWLAEYVSRTECTLREVDLAGAERRAPRPVECGVRPLAGTPHGLWVQEDVDAFTAAQRAAPPGEAVLLDPDSLAELARYPAIAVVDGDRVLTFANRYRGGAVRLLDLRTGEATVLDRPDLDAHFDVRGVSPDGRWLAVMFGTMSRMPHTVDVWVLDLISLEWQRLPSMPALGSPMGGVVAGWAPDGRLVLVGHFNQDTGFVTQLATWRVGEAELSLMEYSYPLGRRGIALIM
jgi:hypothetical protein